MTINWTILFENLGIFGIIVGAISWVLKTLGQDAISRRFKAYEKELDIKSTEYQAGLNTELESHKAKLNIEHTQFSKLHEKRLEIMTVLYRKITALDRAMLQLTAIIKLVSPNQTAEQLDQEHAIAAQNAYNSFREYYDDNRIFFSENNCELIDKLSEKYWDSFWDGTTRQRMGGDDYKYNYELASKASETVRTHIPPIKKSLEIELRLTLGVK